MSSFLFGYCESRIHEFEMFLEMYVGITVPFGKGNERRSFLCSFLSFRKLQFQSISFPVFGKAKEIGWESESLEGENGSLGAWGEPFSPLFSFLLGINFLSYSIFLAPKHGKGMTFLSQGPNSANQTWPQSLTQK